MGDISGVGWEAGKGCVCVGSVVFRVLIEGL